jgi:transcription antitermination factor NusG
MSESKNWYAVYTRPKLEKKVAGAFTRNNIENYCPLNKVNKHHAGGDRKKIAFEPLFPSYVFIRVAEAELTSIKKTDGVINMIYWLGEPVIIRDVEIDMIKIFLRECTNVSLEKRPIQSVSNGPVNAGSSTEIKNNFLVVKTRNIKMELPSLGYVMHAEAEKGNVKIIEPGVTKQYETYSEQFAVKL